MVRTNVLTMSEESEQVSSSIDRSGNKISIVALIGALAGLIAGGTVIFVSGQKDNQFSQAAADIQQVQRELETVNNNIESFILRSEQNTARIQALEDREWSTPMQVMLDEMRKNDPNATAEDVYRIFKPRSNK